MYQGKFDAKNRKSSTDVSQLVAQRSTAPAKQAQPHPAAANAPQPRAAAPAKKKKGPRLGGTIFYTVYFLFILLFFVATYFGLQWLQGWLVDYEAAQPTAKSREVFQQLFTSPDWGQLYDAAGAQDSAYEGRDAYVAYMTEKVGSQELTMKETSAGLSGGKKYNILLGTQRLASFTLVDKSSAQTDLPDWQLDQLEVFFDRSGVYYVTNVEGHKVLVNGVALTDDNLIQIVTVGAKEYLPISVTGISTCTQEITGLMCKPTVTIFDEKGSQMEVSYDEQTHTFTEQTTANTITDEETEVVRKAIQTYGLFMIKKASRADIAKCFDASSDTYNTITHLGDLWTQGNKGYEFQDEAFTGYIRYTDDLFSIRASVRLLVTRTDDTIKEFNIDQSMIFRKQATGKWLCIEMTNEDFSNPEGKVRLTFMDGTTKIDSRMVSTDITKLSPPAVSVPDGKVFSGWYRIDTDENGITSYNMVFDPDDNGNVTIPAGTTLEPMTLYALYEDAATTEGA